MHIKSTENRRVPTLVPQNNKSTKDNQDLLTSTEKYQRQPNRTKST